MEDDKDTELDYTAIWLGENFNFGWNYATNELEFYNKKADENCVSFTLTTEDKYILFYLLVTKLDVKDFDYDPSLVLRAKKMMQRKLRTLRKEIVKGRKNNDKARD